VPHINGSHNHGIQFCCWWCKEHRRGASLETDNQHRASSGKNKECSKGDGCRAAGRSCSWCLWMRTSTVLFLGAVEVDVVLLQAECARSMKYIMLPERQAQQDGRPRCPVSANSSSGPLCRWTRLAIKDWILFTGYIYMHFLYWSMPAAWYTNYCCDGNKQSLLVFVLLLPFSIY
jgi:hypothetical protein